MTHAAERTDIGRELERSGYAELPQRLQGLLGFNQAASYLGSVNGRHPRDWPMNS